MTLLKKFSDVHMWFFLKSRDNVPPVTEQVQIDSSYKYWRIQLM